MKFTHFFKNIVSDYRNLVMKSDFMNRLGNVQASRPQFFTHLDKTVLVTDEKMPPTSPKKTSY